MAFYYYIMSYWYVGKPGQVPAIPHKITDKIINNVFVLMCSLFHSWNLTWGPTLLRTMPDLTRGPI